MLANALFRPDKVAPTEWKLHPEIFAMICWRIDHPNVNLFATSQNFQLTTYISPVPDPQAKGYSLRAAKAIALAHRPSTMGCTMTSGVPLSLSLKTGVRFLTLLPPNPC